MSSTETSPAHLPALGRHVVEDVGRALQETLVELVDLSLAGKQLHWSVVGSHFRSLHVYLDELIDSWRKLSDTVAERAVAIGYWPDGQAQAIVAGEDRLEVKAGPIEDQVVIRNLGQRLARVTERVRSRMDRMDELDGASQDVLVEVVRAIEEQLWMLRSQLPEASAGTR